MDYDQSVNHKELKAAVIGYGLAGSSFHAPFIAATPGLELTTVVTSNPERQQQARARYPDVRVLATADELWAAADIDVVVIASPNRSHVPLAHAAIAHRVPVVVDKPLAASAADSRALVDAARRANVLLTVYQNRRWDGDFLTLRRLLDAAELGRIIRFESRFEKWRPQLRGGWREQADPADAGGLLFDIGSHLIDQALFLFGPALSVYAELDRRRDGAAVDDDSFVALRHVSGVRSHLWMSAVATDPGPRFRVTGSNAAYVKWGLDVQEDALRIGGRPGTMGWGEEPAEKWGQVVAGSERRTVPAVPGSYQSFYAALGAALRGDGPVPVDPENAVQTLTVIEAAQESACERTVIDLVRRR